VPAAVGGVRLQNARDVLSDHVPAAYERVYTANMQAYVVLANARPESFDTSLKLRNPCDTSSMRCSWTALPRACSRLQNETESSRRGSRWHANTIQGGSLSARVSQLDAKTAKRT
jgi:hypothetical protein